MFEKQLIASVADSLATHEPEPTLTDADRLLQLYEHRTGFCHWKVIFPGSVVLSRRAAEMLGLPEDRGVLPLQDMVKTYVQDDRGKLLSLIAQSLEGRRGFHCRLRVDRRDGGLRVIETVADLRIRDGKVLELFGANRDVTSKMERELQVQGRLKLNQDLVADMPAPIVVLDDRLRVVDCSLHWLKAHRILERREALGRNIVMLFPDMSAEHKAELESALRGQTIKTRRTYVSPTTSQPVSFSTVISPWYLGDRKVGGITIATGWAEIAVTRAPLSRTDDTLAEFDGTLLDMLKTVS